MEYRTRFIVVLIALVIMLGFGALQFFNSGKSKTETVNTLPMVPETVTRGDVVLSIKTSGVVDSDNDILLRSPERSIVKSLHINAGSKVSKGDLLVELEAKGIDQEIERLNQQLEVKRNTLEKYQLNQENTRLGMKQSEEVKRNRLANLKTALMQQEEALKVGGIDAARVERTRNEIEVAETDLQNLIDKNEIRLQQLGTDEKGLQLQISSQTEEIANRLRLLTNLRIVAPADGVIQEVSVQQGERVESEQLLMRMSDFSSYKVVGWANVSYAGLILTGDSAVVEVDNKSISGTVGELSQMYEDQMIRFDVHLTNNQDSSLEMNKSVVVKVISSKRENVLRIKKLDAFENTTQQAVYLVNGSEGTKTNIIIGLIGNDWCEVVSGVKEGDVIIASGASSDESADIIAIK